MTHFLLSLMLVSFLALPQASASSEETPVELKTHILKIPYGYSFRQPTKEDLAALPAEEIDASEAWKPPCAQCGMETSSQVKVVYEPTKEPLTLQTMCEALRTGQVFEIAYECESYHICAFLPKGTTDEGEPIENCFKVTKSSDPLKHCFYVSASHIFDDASVSVVVPLVFFIMERIEDPQNTFVMPKPGRRHQLFFERVPTPSMMKHIESSPDTSMIPLLSSPTHQLREQQYLQARWSMMMSEQILGHKTMAP